MPAVRNIGQWAQAWSSNIAWMRKAEKIIKCFLKCLIIGCKVLSLAKIMTLTREEAPANFVPAAAVIRREQALFEMIGRKEFVGGICCYL